MCTSCQKFQLTGPPRLDGKATVAVLQALLAENPTAAFARADIISSGDLMFDECHLALCGEEDVEADVLRSLCDEFDIDQNGCVSIAEFQACLKRANGRLRWRW